MEAAHAAPAGSAAHDHAAHSAFEHLVECDGSYPPTALKGSWKGHVLPGCVFIVWGSWWAYNVITYHLWRSAARPYRGRAWYPLGVRALWLLEPALKVAVPLVALFMELYWDHAPPAFRHLYCPPGTKFAGRFDMAHTNNWQHAASYPAVMLSGLVDVAARYLPLPAGTCQAFLGVAFGVMAFLMGTHEKHEPQDKMVHWLLFLAMSASAAMVFLEMALRRHVLAGLGRALSVVTLGAWLCQIAAVEFEGRPQWSESYAGGAMFAPVVFCMVFLLALACLLAFYVLLAALDERGLLPRPAALPADEPEERQEAEDGDLLPRHHHLHHALHRHRCDSAHASDDSASDEGDGLLQGPHGAGAGAVQLAAKSPAGFV